MEAVVNIYNRGGYFRIEATFSVNIYNRGGYFRTTASINGLTEAVVIMQPSQLIDD
jgi:hypothetical protein